GEGAPEPVGVPLLAEVPAAGAAVRASAARSGDARHDALSDPPARDARAERRDLATHLVAHRDGQRDPGVAARQKLQAGAAGQGGAPAQHDPAQARRGHLEIAFFESPDRGLDERLHDLRAPMKRARSGSTPPPRGSPSAASTASAMFSARRVRERSTPQTTGKVAFPAAASLWDALPSVAASDSTSSRSSLIWNASPIRRPYWSIRWSVASSAPARIAPAASEARMRRPVLFSWMRSSSSAVGDRTSSASMSAIWPPIIPRVPIASTTVSSTRTFAAAWRSPLG